MEPMPELDPGTIIRVLNKHRVRYVVIGGVAAEIHDLPVPATGLYTAEAAGTWFPRTPVELWSQYDTLHLMTTAGPIDIVFAPDGAPSGYAELVDDAMSAALDHQEVMVITVAQWEALKQASGRAKDLEHLDRFYASRSEE
jgi:hypothetical protein